MCLRCGLAALSPAPPPPPGGVPGYEDDGVALREDELLLSAGAAEAELGLRRSVFTGGLPLLVVVVVVEEELLEAGKSPPFMAEATLVVRAPRRCFPRGRGAGGVVCSPGVSTSPCPSPGQQTKDDVSLTTVAIFKKVKAEEEAEKIRFVKRREQIIDK